MKILVSSKKGWEVSSLLPSDHFATTLQNARGREVIAQAKQSVEEKNTIRVNDILVDYLTSNEISLSVYEYLESYIVCRLSSSPGLGPKFEFIKFAINIY